MIRTLIVEDDFRVARLHAEVVERLDGFTVMATVHTASAAGFYSAEYEFAARPRQPIVVEIELVPRTLRKEEVEVRGADISMGETGSSRWDST